MQDGGADDGHELHGRIPHRSPEIQGRIDRHLGERPPDRRPLRWRLATWIASPGRRWAERRHDAGLPPLSESLTGLIVISVATWFCVAVPLAYLIYREGGVLPNKAADEVYFAWQPSPEHGRHDAVSFLLFTAVMCPWIFATTYRQQRRDAERAAAELASEQAELIDPTRTTDDDGRGRMHPFPPRSTG